MVYATSYAGETCSGPDNFIILIAGCYSMVFCCSASLFGLGSDVKLKLNLVMYTTVLSGIASRYSMVPLQTLFLLQSWISSPSWNLQIRISLITIEGKLVYRASSVIMSVWVLLERDKVGMSAQHIGAEFWSILTNQV